MIILRYDAICYNLGLSWLVVLKYYYDEGFPPLRSADRTHHMAAAVHSEMQILNICINT